MFVSLTQITSQNILNHKLLRRVYDESLLINKTMHEIYIIIMMLLISLLRVSFSFLLPHKDVMRCDVNSVAKLMIFCLRILFFGQWSEVRWC